MLLHTMSIRVDFFMAKELTFINRTFLYKLKKKFFFFKFRV